MGRNVVARLGAMLETAPGLIPGAVFTMLAVWWSARDGGFDPLVWIPGSLLLVSLTVVYLVAAPRRRRTSRTVSVAMGLLLAFTCWCFLSIRWSEMPDLAWSGSNLTAVYLTIFVLFAWRPWPAGVVATLLGLFSVSVAAIGLVSLLRAATADTTAGFFIAGRLATPITYPNANAALFVSAAVPAVFLASRREVNWAARGLLLASAGVLAELALLCQSRATMIALPLTLLLFLVITPGRMRVVVALVAVVAVVGLAGSRPGLHVYEAVVSGDGTSAALATIRTRCLVIAGALFAIGVAFAAFDFRVVVPRRATVGAGVTILALALIGAGLGSVMLVDRYQPRANATIWWERFKGGSYLYEPGTPHFVSGLGSGRYDIWRVSFDAFEREPWLGAGVDTFGAEYLRQRTRLQDPLYPHSIELRTLGETGIVGAALVLGFFAAVAVGAARRLRGGSELSRGVVATCVTVVAYWLIHGSVDWLWEMPILGAFAFACMGLACTTGSTTSPDAPIAESGQVLGWQAHRATWMAASVAGVLLCVSMAFPWLAARDIAAAASSWPSDSSGAFERLDRARTYNPLSDQPDIYAAVIAAQIGDIPRQQAALEHALSRNPTNWYTHLALGALVARQGNLRSGLEQLKRARTLNPLDPVIQEVEQRVRQGKPPSNAELDRLLVARLDLLTGGRQG